jgi:hypothetical protein
LTGIEDSEDKLVGAAAERLWVGRPRVAAERAEAGDRLLGLAAERAEAEDRLAGLARLAGLTGADDGLRDPDALREAGAALEAGALRAAGLRAAGVRVLLLAALAELPLLDLARVVLRGVLDVLLVSVAVAIEPQFWSLFRFCYPRICDR